MGNICSPYLLGIIVGYTIIYLLTFAVIYDIIYTVKGRNERRPTAREGLGSVLRE